MIAETARAMRDESTTDAAGRRRRKTKAQRTAEESRLAVLVAVLVNVSGRQVSVDELRAQLAA